MVDHSLSEQRVLCGSALAPEVDERVLTALTVDAAKLAEIPNAKECVVVQIIDYPGRAIVLGRMVQMHVRDDCLDEASRYVRPEVYQPLARLHANSYIIPDRQFRLKKTAEHAAPEAAFLTSLDK